MLLMWRDWADCHCALPAATASCRVTCCACVVDVHAYHTALYLYCRYLLYQKVQQSHGSKHSLHMRLEQDPALAQAMHQFAWKGLLHSAPVADTPSTNQPVQLPPQQDAPLWLARRVGRAATLADSAGKNATLEPPIVDLGASWQRPQPGSDAAVAADAAGSGAMGVPQELQVKLQRYMGAYVQWRQQQHEELLSTAELMDCVQEEEQVGDHQAVWLLGYTSSTQHACHVCITFGACLARPCGECSSS